MAIGDSIYMLLRDETRRACAPATVHLNYLKGTAIPGRRRPYHLRTLAGPPIATGFSYLHISDEPADVLREMRVLFGPEALREILSEFEAGGDRTSQALQLIRQVERQTPPGVLCSDPGAPCSPLAPRFSGTSAADDAKHDLRSDWRDLVAWGVKMTNFVGGDSYRSEHATIPDGPELARPLDAHLLYLGPRY
jgi:hypothetical protein